MKHFSSYSLAPALTMILATYGTVSLADENEVYLGQTGVTNVIDVEQAGNSNKIGADESTIFISQQGTSNEMTISQTGYANEAGASAPTGTLGLYGLYQTGANNILDITQENDNSAGTNMIGAIDQQSPDTYASSVSNSLTIIQSQNSIDGTTGTGDGQGNHVIEEVQQIQSDDNGAPNVAIIRQYDGALGIGDDGNSIGWLIQNGSGNYANVIQQYRGNSLEAFRQLGTDNEAEIFQQAGVDNLIAHFDQIGSSNRSVLAMIGSRNLIWSAIQNNDLVSVTGNIMTVTLEGDDNGGDGFGGLGQFSHDNTKQLQVSQAEIKQLGDHNTLNMVTTSASAMTQFGFVQDGDGNWISGTIDGIENEIGAEQIGDGNRLTFAQTGEQNAMAVSYKGKDNELNAIQNGDENTMTISFDGGISPLSRSDQTNDTALGGFSDITLAYAGSLTPGDAIQNGNLNVASIHVMGGSFNKFAFSQSGDQNEIDGEIEGISNQSVVSQSYGENYAYYRQYGNNNQIIILQ
ncbi:hypothetical protein [uncultured Cohaesibacter sp.]|uniref:hypothetical protein n=1 Tax=uncultured Cohaesibacter sp. TaxID=1002546 RepID=UPI0029C957CF|nr:hypothetical protein [uncultured Cohaesibacter sp.]